MSDPRSSTASSPAESLSFDFVKIIGPLQYGILANWALMGLLIHQVYVYTTRFAKRDARYLRILVNVVLVLELLFTGALTHVVHSVVVAGWGSTRAITKLPISAVMICPSSSTMAVIVQMFFLWRVWKLNPGSRAIQLSICVGSALSCTHFASAIAIDYVWSKYPHLNLVTAKGDPTLNGLFETGFCAGFAADLFTAGLMVISLLRLRRKHRGIKSTWKMINTLILRSIQTGIVTTIVTLLGLILHAHPKMKDDASFAAIGLPLGKLYSTMLMANLNGRGQFSGATEVLGTGSSRTVVFDSQFNNDISLDVRMPNNPSITASRDAAMDRIDLEGGDKSSVPTNGWRI